MAETTEKTVHELLAESLVAHGVSHIFGLVGDANLFMVDAFVKSGKGRYVGCAHEASTITAAIGYAQESGIPYGMGIIRNQYMGRTFIEPTDQIRNMGVRLKLNVNRSLIAGKRVVLVDDSVVRGTTSRKIKEMIVDAGAAEVHFRIASPPTAWPCFYGVDTPQREKLLAATMSEEEMRAHLAVDSLRFISLDGLYRAVGEAGGRNAACPQYCDACFSGEYPVEPADMIEQGFRVKAAAE